MDRSRVIEATRLWVSSVVIGLNLCPFARRVFETDRIRYSVTEAACADDLLLALDEELSRIVAAPIEAVETTLLIHPCAFGDFLDYNDFLDRAEQRIEERDLAGVIQIASFHPNYRFADTRPNAVENYTNRSPYPMLHLLREESVTAIGDDSDDLLEIPERNIATMRRLGKEKILAMLRAIGEP